MLPHQVLLEEGGRLCGSPLYCMSRLPGTHIQLCLAVGVGSAVPTLQWSGHSQWSWCAWQASTQLAA